MGALCRVRGLNDVYISQVAMNQVEAFSDVGNIVKLESLDILDMLAIASTILFFIELSEIIFATAAIILQLFFFLQCPNF